MTSELIVHIYGCLQMELPISWLGKRSEVSHEKETWEFPQKYK